MSDPQSDKIKYKIYKLFKQCGLKTIIKTNLQIANFTVVTLNYRLENTIHPKNIIKEISNMIRKRISVIPSYDQEFDKVKDDQALEKLDSFSKVKSDNHILEKNRR